MRSLWQILTLVVLVLVFGIGSVADACYCVAARHCHRRPCMSWEEPCCVVNVMQTCQEVVYEEQQQTCYKTVYAEVVEKVPVEAVKYVEGTAYHCAPCTVMQPCQPPACGPTRTCAPAACGEAAPCGELKPVQVLRKVPYTTMTPQKYQKMEEVRRVVAKQVPYTITVCVPKVVCRQVPATVYCPIPCCAPAAGKAR
jgi:hypothetical protein